ncbi:hypothetical protein [Ancylobacter mangrovi]|uniref:hypothetical protein n=1 Tax=Ancylobacter mangrovi TaxID=2972472 RepID=UPI002163A1D5|nr:hypothetical protein [Ancylobacter mangrovi]MCS0505138.1 hypothetical protein [Ancylobacter mangrovi]
MNAKSTVRERKVMPRNPDWTYEEAVLLHALYRRAPRAGRRHPAVEQLSGLLAVTAALRGVDASGTYRNATGVAMRLSNVASIDPAHLARGLKGLPDGPRIDKVVWARFAEDPVGLAAEEARILAAWQTSPVAHEAPQSPSRGPAPSFGEIVATRIDGPTVVYLLRLEGPVDRLITGDRPVLKLGLSNDVDRRIRELNAGFPESLGLAWHLVRSWVSPSGAAAWAVERAALMACHAAGWSLGGEFFRCSLELATAVVSDEFASLDRAN